MLTKITKWEQERLNIALMILVLMFIYITLKTGSRVETLETKSALTEARLEAQIDLLNRRPPILKQTNWFSPETIRPAALPVWTEAKMKADVVRREQTRRTTRPPDTKTVMRGPERD